MLDANRQRLAQRNQSSDSPKPASNAQEYVVGGTGSEVKAGPLEKFGQLIPMQPDAPQLSDKFRWSHGGEKVLGHRRRARCFPVSVFVQGGRCGLDGCPGPRKGQAAIRA